MLGLIKVMLILITGVAGLLGSLTTLTVTCPETEKKHITLHGKYLIAFVVVSMITSALIQIWELEQQAQDRAAEAKIIQQRTEQLSDITENLQSSLRLSDRVYQTITKLDRYRTEITFRIDVELDQSKWPENTDPYSFWLGTELSGALDFIFFKITGKELSEVPNEDLVKQRWVDEIGDWEIYGDSNGVLRFKLDYKKSGARVPQVLSNRDSIFFKKFEVVREGQLNSWDQFKDNRPSDQPSFEFHERLAISYASKFITKDALASMESNKMHKFPAFPTQLFYDVKNGRIYFSLFHDIYRGRRSARNNTINFNLKDLQESQLYIVDKFSDSQGPYIVPIKVRIQAPNVPDFHFISERAENIMDIPKGVSVYELKTIDRMDWASGTPYAHKTRVFSDGSNWLW